MVTFPCIKEDGVNIHLMPDRAYLSYKGKEVGVFTSTHKKKEASLVINNTGAEILTLTDGRHSLFGIVRYFVEKYSERADKVHMKVLQFYEQLRDAHNINVQFLNGPRPQPMTITGSSEYYIPLSVPVEITYRCNLHCLHCYTARTGEKNPPEMSLGQARDLLDQLRALGVKTIEFTGGEPTLHTDFLSILEHAFSLNFQLVGILTNGTRLNEDLRACIKSNRPDVAMQIDLHGNRPEYVKWFTGDPEAFTLARRAIEDLAGAGVLVRVVASITPQNIDQMEGITNIARDAGALGVAFGPIAPLGNAKKRTDLIISTNEAAFQRFLDEFSRLQAEHGDYISYIEEELFSREQNCGAGSKGLTITPSGDIKLCQMADSSLIQFGNLFTQPIRALLKEKKHVLKAFAGLPAPEAEDCGECPDFWFCQHCLVRGLIKAKEKGENCRWLQKLVPAEIMNYLSG